MNTDRVGIQNNFFDIGGTSLLSVKVLSKIREKLQIEIPIIRIYQYPTIEQMAKFVSYGLEKQGYAEVDERAQKQRMALARKRKSIKRR